jgi:hypothetical protein
MPNAESIGPCTLSQGPSGKWSLTFYDLHTTAAIARATRDNVMD